MTPAACLGAIFRLQRSHQLELRFNDPGLKFKGLTVKFLPSGKVLVVPEGTGFHYTLHPGHHSGVIDFHKTNEHLPEGDSAKYETLAAIQQEEIVRNLEAVAKPVQGGYHSFYRHYHLSFDEAEGKANFRAEINRIFERNGIAYELAESGQVERTAPEVLRELLAETLFQTEDTTLNELLEKARTKFLSRDAATRKESLEALWDAWERLKSLELGKDKKESVGKLLDKVTAEPNFRELLELEARQLTDIGNKFMIRHTEVGKVPVDDDEQIDYLFHRLFSLIRLLLKMSNRGG